MNKQEKLIENTMLALQGKLLKEDDSDNKKFERKFYNKINNLVAPLYGTCSKDENLLIASFYASAIINRKECQKYIQDKYPIPEDLKDIDFNNSESKRKKFHECQKYINTSYYKGEMEYMKNHKDEIQETIKSLFAKINVKIKSLELREVDHNGDGFDDGIYYSLYCLLNKWVNPIYLYIFDYDVYVVMDINDNLNVNVEDSNDTSKISSPYNPGWADYKETGDVYAKVINTSR